MMRIVMRWGWAGLSGCLAVSALSSGCAPDLTLLPGEAGGAGGAGGSGQGGSSGAASEGGVAIWSEHFPGAGDQAGPSLAVNAKGDIILHGALAGSVDFGNGSLDSAGGDDLVMARFDAAGKLAFASRFGDEAPQVGRTVALDDDDNALVAGDFSGSFDFGGTAATSAGGRDGFVARLDAMGTPAWLYRFGDGGYQAGMSVAADGDGNVFVVGAFSGSADFGSDSLKSAGAHDLFVAKLDGEGNPLWGKSFGDGLEQRAVSVAVDAMGNAFVLGEIEGAINFGGTMIASAGSTDVFVAKLGSDGTPLWANRFGDVGPQAARAIAVDGTGAVLVAGEMGGGIDFGGGALPRDEGGGLFVAKLDGAGKHVWSKGLPVRGTAQVRGMAVDGVGNVIVVGEFDDQLVVDGKMLASAGAEDVFAVKMDASGKLLWGKRFGDAEAQRASGVGIDGEGNAVIAGAFGGTIDFGKGALVSGGDMDMLLVKLSP